MNFARNSRLLFLPLLLAGVETFSASALYAAPSNSEQEKVVPFSNNGQSATGSPSLEQELTAARKVVLTNRPYKSNFSKIQEVVSLEVLPSSLLPDSPVPDWWSEKQRYDLARLYSIALSYYPIFKVVPPDTWDQRVLSREGLSAQDGEITNAVSSSMHRLSKEAAGLGNLRKQTSFGVDLYSFQHMPVKRKGIGLGFIAITSKECSTETFLRSSVQLSGVLLEPRANASLVSGNGDNLISEDQALVLNRMVVDKTGGTSLNLNFLVGGAGGGNFDPPAKPLKQILLESVVDAAEAASCMATSDQACLDYYRSRPRLQPTKLTPKQKKKVGSC